MNTRNPTVSHRFPRHGFHRRQHGGETVEFALLALPFLLMVFAIIDVGLAVFNQGVVNHAASVAARQGSLFWLDPGNYSTTDPLGNVRVREQSMISAVQFYDANILINLGGNTLSPLNIDMPGAALAPNSGAQPNRIWNRLAGSQATVPLTFQHDFMVTSALGILSDYTMDTNTRLNTEFE